MVQRDVGIDRGLVAELERRVRDPLPAVCAGRDALAGVVAQVPVFLVAALRSARATRFLRRFPAASSTTIVKSPSSGMAYEIAKGGCGATSAAAGTGAAPRSPSTSRFSIWAIWELRPWAVSALRMRMRRPRVSSGSAKTIHRPL